MQTSNSDYLQARLGRTRKYDTYMPPQGSDLSAANTPTPVASQQVQQQYHATSYYAVPVQSDAQQARHYSQVTEVPRANPVQHRQKQRSVNMRKSLLAPIMKTTVKVDKVSRRGMLAMRHTFEPPHIHALRTKKQRFLVRAFYIVGTASFIFAVGMGLNMIFGKKTPAQHSNTGVLGVSSAMQNDANRASEAPSEQKPSRQDYTTYLVAPQYPRYIRIPSIGVEARVRRLGVDSKGAIGSPNNIFDAGWYDGSVRPGERDGASVIIGHVAGAKEHGLFWSLASIGVGSTVEVEKGNGEIITYKVTKIEKLPGNNLDMSSYLKPDTAGRNDLKLITAAGKFEDIGTGYTGRVVVHTQIL